MKTAILGVWLAFNFIPFLYGLVFAIDRPKACHEPLSRIEYAFPGFRVGCYLGSPIKPSKDAGGA